MALVVKSSTETETTRETGPDGCIKETVVTKTTETLSDGSRKTKTNTETRFLPNSSESATGGRDSKAWDDQDFPSRLHRFSDQPKSQEKYEKDGGLSRSKDFNFGAKPFSTTESSQSQPLESFLNEALQSHNTHRKAHGVSPLTLDPKMNKFAQEWAQHMAATNSLQHRPRTQSSFGENVFCCSGMIPTGKYVVDNWYSEVERYNFNNPGYTSGIGHFTQVVWKSSAKLGMGRATSSGGSTFVVANYDPAGNINTPQNFRDNVFRKK